MLLKLIYIAVLVMMAGIVVAQEVKTTKTPEQTAHERAVERNRKTAKKLKAQHRRELKRKSLKRDKRDVLKPKYHPHPKYQPHRVSRPAVEQ